MKVAEIVLCRGECQTFPSPSVANCSVANYRTSCNKLYYFSRQYRKHLSVAFIFPYAFTMHVSVTEDFY